MALRSTRENKVGPLTEKEKVFCREYIKDFNGSRAAKAAGYKAKSVDSLKSMAWDLCQFPRVKAQIKELQANLEELSGISRMRVLQEYANIAFSSIASFHNNWIDRKDFKKLSEEQKSCIAGITTKTISKKGRTIHLVQIRLYDKNKALDSISKMLGFESPQKIDLTSLGEKLAHAPEIKVYNTAPPLASAEDEIDGPKKSK